MPMSGQGGARRAPAAAGRGRSGGGIPCEQCPNPRACREAGQCMLKAGPGMKRGGKATAKKSGTKKSGSGYGRGMARGGKATSRSTTARKTTTRKPASRKR